MWTKARRTGRQLGRHTPLRRARPHVKEGLRQEESDVELEALGIRRGRVDSVARLRRRRNDAGLDAGCEVRHRRFGLVQRSRGRRQSRVRERTRAFFNFSADPVSPCNGSCHITDVQAGFFGTDGRSQFDAEPQNFKVPHLRNAYQKVGMAGRGTVGLGVPPTEFMGDQIRGFGYSHDGAVDNLIGFLSSSPFNLTPQQRMEVASFVLAFDSNMDPIVGQQVTVTAGTADAARVRYALLVEAATTTTPRRICDLVGHGVVSGEARGYVLRSDGNFKSDRAGEAPVSPLAMLTALSQDSTAAVTFTCMPPGSGVRAGIDRDRDAALDRDELDAGTDPADPTSK